MVVLIPPSDSAVELQSPIGGAPDIDDLQRHAGHRRPELHHDPRGAAPMPGFDLLEKLAGAHDTLTVTHEITK